MGHNGPSWNRRELRVRMAEDAARRAQAETDRLVCIAWNLRVAESGLVEPSPTIRVALECGYEFLRVRCRVCRQTAWLPLRGIRRPPDTPVSKLMPRLWCRPCRADGRARSPTGMIERLTTTKSYGIDES